MTEIVTANGYAIIDKVEDVRDPGFFRILVKSCLLYTSPSPRDMRRSRMPSSA